MTKKITASLTYFSLLQTDAEQTSVDIKQNFGDKPILDSLGE